MSFNGNGVYSAAEQRFSPNTGDRIDPSFIVMHYTAGWNAESAINILSRGGSRVSAHFVIDREGRLTQLVSCNLAAWHAGPSRWQGYTSLNSHSIGIEFVNIGYLKPTSKHYALDPYGHERRLNDLPMASKPVSFISAPHPRIGSGVYLWPTFTPAQLSTADTLVSDILDNYSIQNILSHEQIDTRGWKTDPGPAFPMERYRALLDDGADEPRLYRVNAHPHLNVRGGPGTGFEVNDKLRNLTTVGLVAENGDWFLVRYNKGNSEGWVHSAYLVAA